MNRGVGILIVRNDKILLGHRCEGWSNRTWTMPGGKLGKREKPEDGAKREVKEETGLEVDKLELISVNKDMIKDKEFATYIFKSEIVTGEPKIMEPKEINKWKWFDFKKLPHLLYLSSCANNRWLYHNIAQRINQLILCWFS